MTGSPSMPGLTPKAIDELFRHIDERPHCNVRVTTYFVELYNDNLVDLYFVLDNKNKPGIAEPPKLGEFILCFFVSVLLCVFFYLVFCVFCVLVLAHVMNCLVSFFLTLNVAV